MEETVDKTRKKKEIIAEEITMKEAKNKRKRER